MSGYSLRRRLLLWLFAATTVLGVVALADTWTEARRTAQGVSDRVLAGSALAIAERVTVDEGGGLQVDIPYSALEMLTSTAQDQVFYRVDGPDGFLTGYQTLAPLVLDITPLRFADGLVVGVPVRIATLDRAVSDGQASIGFSVTVAESTRARDQLANAILWRTGLRLLALALVAAGVVWLAVSAALRPLNRLGDAIALRSPDDLRPVQGATPREVAGLVEAINSFMARLDLAVQALRNFTGNASHQLRTPLATVRTQLAMAQRSSDPQTLRDATAKADAALARAERVLAQLLVLARVDAARRNQSFQPTDMAALARILTAEMVPEAQRRGIDLGYEGPGAALALAEPVLAQEMLSNLIDNAIRYAGTGAQVTVRVTPLPDRCRLEVEDNGPGLSAAQIAAFHGVAGPRAGPAVPSAAQGFGLGQAIVREIAQLLEARIEIAVASGGSGLRVMIDLVQPASAGRADG
jgi:two-component system sensor histidine kinase TctE